MSLLELSLSVAVPMWQERINTWTEEKRYERAQECAFAVASNGDVIQFREKNRTGEAFNRLAEGLALLSYAPGGVTFLGLHFDAPAHTAMVSAEGGQNESNPL